MMHLYYLREHDERFDLVAIADSHAPTLAEVSKRYAITDAYADYHDLLARADIEAVLILHGGSHFDSVMAALDAGKDIFVEKPLGWNVSEVERIAERARQSDRIVQIGYHKRYDPGFTEARKLVQERANELAYARITVLHPEDGLGWSTHRVRRGNGVIIEGHREPGAFEDTLRGVREALAEGDLAPLVDAALGSRRDQHHLRLAYGMMTVSLIHQIYTLWGFLGAPERVLSTDLWRGGLSMHSIFTYPNGLHVTLDWHWLSSLKDYREEYAFFTNDSRIYLTFPSPYMRNFPTPITVQGHEGELAWEKKIIVSYDEPFRLELLAFHDNVISRRQPETGVAEALEHAHFIQQMIDAAR